MNLCYTPLAVIAAGVATFNPFFRQKNQRVKLFLMFMKVLRRVYRKSRMWSHVLREDDQMGGRQFSRQIGTLASTKQIQNEKVAVMIPSQLSTKENMMQKLQGHRRAIGRSLKSTRTKDGYFQNYVIFSIVS